MADLIRIPKRFYDDHHDRDLASPDVVKETQKHYFVSPDDGALGELFEDAHHYGMGGVEAFEPYLVGLIISARATYRAIAQRVKRPERTGHDVLQEIRANMAHHS